MTIRLGIYPPEPAVAPPQTLMAWPEIAAAMGEQRNRTVEAISSTSAIRLIGTAAIAWVRKQDANRHKSRKLTDECARLIRIKMTLRIGISVVSPWHDRTWIGEHH